MTRMSLTAVVKVFTGRTRHRIASHDGVVEIPEVVRVRIEPVDGAYFLFRIDAAGRVVADTWHQTIPEAQHQARFEYGIELADWHEATDADHHRSPGDVAGRS